MQETYVIKYNDCAVTALTQQTRMDENSMSRHIVRLSRGNIAQVAVLELAPSENALGDRVQICVANTHLYSNHMYPDVKLWQTATLMREIEAFVTQRDLPLIICGDFNSEPHSAVYQYMSQGAVDAGHQDLEPVLDKMLPNLENSRHSLELYSAMQLITGEEPEYTNYTAGFKGVLDYIWFNPHRLRAAAVVELPPPSALLYGIYGLPNATYPSDHLFLCCDFIVGNVVPGLGPFMGGASSASSSAAMAGATSRNVRRQFSNSPPPTQAANGSKMKQPTLSRHTTR
jgi:CCR4-NOT transcription complex subunit 6